VTLRVSRFLAVTYFRPRYWLIELQRSMMAAILKIMASPASETHNNEASWENWLASPLFQGGYHQDDQLNQEEQAFLQSFVNCQGCGADLHRKMNRSYLSSSAFQLSSISSTSGA